MSLKKKTRFAFFWSALERVGNQGLMFAIQILLARLIAPEEFGLLALLVIFTTLCQLVVDGGFTQAIIQSKEISRLDVSSVFFVNIFLSLLIYGILFFAAPYIASFYGEPRLVLLTRVLSLNLVISSFGQIQNGLLVRNLQFKKLFYISTPAIVISGVVGVVMALQGFEVWALVGARFASRLVSTTCYWFMSDRSYWPRFEFSVGSVKRLGSFGLGMLGTSLLYHGTQNIYGLLIGKAFSVETLAFYNRARSFHKQPSSALTKVLNRVLFPVFSGIQDEDARIRNALKKGMPTLAFIICPAMIWLTLAPNELITVLLTEKWIRSADLMMFFPIIGIFFTFTAVQSSVIRAKGRAALFFWTSIIKSVFAISVLIYTVQFNAMVVVLGQVIVSICINVFINMPLCQYVCGYSVRDQIQDIGPSLFCSLMAGAISKTSVTLMELNSDLLILFLVTLIFIVSYFLLTKLLGMKQTDMVTNQLRRFQLLKFATQ